MAASQAVELEQGRRRMVYCGTESPLVVVLEMAGDGSLEVRQELVNSENLYRQRNGSPRGMAVEWVALHPSGRFLYAFTCFWDKGRGEAVSYSVDQSTGLLAKCGAPVTTAGHQPCHSDFSPGGSWLALAHYLGRVVSVVDCRSGGLRAAARGVKVPGEDAPLGSMTKGPHVHGVRFSPSGGFLAACDAGQGTVFVYAFDADAGTLSAAPVAAVKSEPSADMHGFVQRQITGRFGTRPRHCAFHPTLPVAYVLTECGNCVGWHSYDPRSGSFGPLLGQRRCTRFVRGTVECLSRSCFLPSVNAAAEIEVSRDGLHLYVSNRGIGPLADNSIVVFQLDAATGEPGKAQGTATDKGPRHFCLFQASGAAQSAVQMLLVGNQGAKSAGLYAVSAADGTLQHVKTSDVGHPVDCVQVLELPARA